jgi:hypothetical protein
MRSWRPRRGLLQKGDGLPRSRRGDDPLAIPRLQAWRLEIEGERYYQIGELVVPSVSTVLRVIAKPNLVSWARRTALEKVRELLGEGLGVETALALAEVEPERQRDAAAQRGGLVHEAIAHALRGEPYPSEWGPWVKAALDFLADFGLQVVGIERVLVSKRHGFAGSCDVVALGGDGRLVLVDWKTGRHPHLPEASLQVGGYSIALREMSGRPVAAGYVVAVRSGRYEAKRVNLLRVQEGFLGALALWKSLRGGLYG